MSKRNARDIHSDLVLKIGHAISIAALIQAADSEQVGQDQMQTVGYALEDMLGDIHKRIDKLYDAKKVEANGAAVVLRHEDLIDMWAPLADAANYLRNVPPSVEGKTPGRQQFLRDNIVHAEGLLADHIRVIEQAYPEMFGHIDESQL